MAKMITTQIAKKCDSIVDLSDIYDEWGGSFDYIHTAAALVKCGKLPGGARSSLVDKLCSIWLTQLSFAGIQECSNVLWVCVRLGPGAVQRVWGPTWEAYIQQLQQTGVEGSCRPQNMANSLWACAKLRKQLSIDDLQLIVHTFVQPAVLADAKPQEVANFVWALGVLCRMPGWQGGVSEQDVQQLLGVHSFSCWQVVTGAKTLPMSFWVWQTWLLAQLLSSTQTLRVSVASNCWAWYMTG